MKKPGAPVCTDAPGEASILAIIMMVFGVAIMLLNQLSTRSGQNYTTVTGKSGQISKITLGK